VYKGDSTAAVAARFAAEHKSLFGHDKPGAPVEVVNLRLIVRAKNRWGALQSRMTSEATGRARTTSSPPRECYFGPDYGAVPTRIIGSRSEVGHDPVAGPFVLEEYDATVVVPPDFRARCDQFNNLWMERAP
jgi:N-methylhydantoinase A